MNSVTHLKHKTDESIIVALFEGIPKGIITAIFM